VEINMTTLPPGIPFSKDAPGQLGERTVIAFPVDSVSNLATEDSQEEWQSRLRSLQRWICELLIKNQQLRWSLLEMKELQPSLTSTDGQPTPRCSQDAIAIVTS
jgi:hypothetical protein